MRQQAHLFEGMAAAGDRSRRGDGARPRRLVMINGALVLQCLLMSAPSSSVAAAASADAGEASGARSLLRSLRAVDWSRPLRLGRKGGRRELPQPTSVAATPSPPSSSSRRRRPQAWSFQRSALAVGLFAAGGLASEAIQYANTALLVAYLRRRTGKDVVGLVDSIVERSRAMGLSAYALYLLAIVSFQVVPVQLSAFIGVLFAGLLFGVWRGTLLVSFACSVSACLSRVIAKRAQRRFPSLELSSIGTHMAALERQLAQAPFSTHVLAITLLRMSPVFPFVPTNYLLGLTSVRPLALFVGTFIGSIPMQAAYISAGVLGAATINGGVRVPPAIAAVGLLATVLACWLMGKLATQALDGTLVAA